MIFNTKKATMKILMNKGIVRIVIMIAIALIVFLIMKDILQSTLH